eukprot:scaffold9427_cov175-Amphora_coffeaeformis.AAC.2
MKDHGNAGLDRIKNFLALAIVLVCGQYIPKLIQGLQSFSHVTVFVRHYLDLTENRAGARKVAVARGSRRRRRDVAFDAILVADFQIIFSNGK